MKLYVVDAFAEKLFTGNPAGVLPCRQMPPVGLMKKIAIENNYSETAFVVPTGPGRYDLRWFTPGGEVDLCGHATLATAFVLHQYADPGVGEMHFHTLSGELIVRAGEDGFTMDFPTGKVLPMPLTPVLMEATSDLAIEAWYDGGDTVAMLESEDALRGFRPDADLIKRVPGLGLILTAPSTEYDFVSRCFYPKVDVPEDPVTGRAHTYLAPVWASKLGKTVFRARQISARGGSVGVRLAGERVFLTGQVQPFLVGEIPFDL